MIQEYRHKKFDTRKRNRDEDDKPVTESILCNEDHSVAQKKQKIENYDSELLQNMELCQPIRESPSPIENLHVPAQAGHPSAVENELSPLIKRENIEPIDSDEAIVTSTTPRTRRGRRKTYSIRSEGYFSSDNEFPVEVKKELIDINTKIANIPSDTIEEICKFRSNMVRKFPKKDRSTKEQERRDKNTFACRRSRRVKKIEQFVVEEAYKKSKTKHISLEEYSIRGANYFHELLGFLESSEEIIVVD